MKIERFEDGEGSYCNVWRGHLLSIVNGSLLIDHCLGLRKVGILRMCMLMPTATNSKMTLPAI